MSHVIIPLEVTSSTNTTTTNADSSSSPSVGFQVWSCILFLFAWMLMAFRVPCLPLGRTGGTSIAAILFVATGVLNHDEAFKAISIDSKRTFLNTLDILAHTVLHLVAWLT